MEDPLMQLGRTYAQKSIVKGSSLLLQPQDALDFIDDLKRINVGVAGIELWYYAQHENQTVIVEDPAGPDLNKYLHSDDPVNASIAAAKTYLTHDLPNRISLVSFVLDRPYSWKSLNQI